jgi:hypothetical protein
MSHEVDYASVRREIIGSLSEVADNIEALIDDQNLDERLNWIELSLAAWVTSDFDPGESLGTVFHQADEVSLVRTIAGQWKELWKGKRGATVAELDPTLLRTFLQSCKSLHHIMVTGG